MSPYLLTHNANYFAFWQPYIYVWAQLKFSACAHKSCRSICFILITSQRISYMLEYYNVFNVGKNNRGNTIVLLQFIHILYSHCTYLLHQYSRLCLKEHFISQQVRDFLPGVYMGDDSQDEALMRKVDNLDQRTCYSCQKHIFQSVCSDSVFSFDNVHF